MRLILVQLRKLLQWLEEATVPATRRPQRKGGSSSTSSSSSSKENLEGIRLVRSSFELEIHPLPTGERCVAP